MKREIISIRSSYEGLTLHATVTFPDSEPLGIVQIMPRITESRFLSDNLATVLASYDYVTICVDYRGHGQSTDANHPLGHMSDSNGWMNNLRDQSVFCEWIRGKYRHLPFYLLAEGCGCLVALSFLKRFEYQINGLVLCGIPVNRPEYILWQTLLEHDAEKKGLREPAEGFAKYLSDRLNRKTGEKNVPAAWLSRDPSVRERYNADSLSGFYFSNRGALDLLFGFRDFYVNKDWHALKKDLPILLLTGEEDPCVEYPKGFEKAGDRIESCGYRQIEENTYPGMRADIVSCQGSENVLRDLLLWYNKITESINAKTIH